MEVRRIVSAAVRATALAITFTVSIAGPAFAADPDVCEVYDPAYLKDVEYDCVDQGGEFEQVGDMGFICHFDGDSEASDDFCRQQVGDGEDGEEGLLEELLQELLGDDDEGHGDDSGDDDLLGGLLHGIPVVGGLGH